MYAVFTHEGEVAIRHLDGKRHQHGVRRCFHIIHLDVERQKVISDFGGNYRLQIFEFDGQLAQAEKDYERAYEQNRNALSTALLGRFYALHGRRDKALQLLEQLKDMARHHRASPGPFALIYLGLGDKNEAIKCLEQTLQDRGGTEATFVQTLKVNPLFDPLRGDPRFEKIADAIVPPDLFHRRK